MLLNSSFPTQIFFMNSLNYHSNFITVFVSETLNLFLACILPITYLVHTNMNQSLKTIFRVNYVQDISLALGQTREKDWTFSLITSTSRNQKGDRWSPWQISCLSPSVISGFNGLFSQRWDRCPRFPNWVGYSWGICRHSMLLPLPLFCFCSNWTSSHVHQTCLKTQSLFGTNYLHTFFWLSPLHDSQWHLIITDQIHSPRSSSSLSWHLSHLLHYPLHSQSQMIYCCLL